MTRKGISVICTVCGQQKKPHGRSAPIDSNYCDHNCEGYWLEPQPGCLWPGETEKQFGYPVCSNATKEVHELGEHAASVTVGEDLTEYERRQRG